MPSIGLMIGLANAGQGGGGGAVASVRQVATRGGFVPEIFNASFTKANHKSVHIFREAVTSFQIEVANFYADAGVDGVEKGPGAATSVTATVFDPVSFSVLATVLFGGVATGSIPNNSTLLSDAIDLSVTKDQALGIAIHEECASGICYGGRSSSPGDGFEFNTVLADKTASPGTIANGSSGLGKMPFAIIGMSSAPAPLMYGDSRIRGSGDGGDVTGDLGSVARSLGGVMNYMNAGVPASWASRLVASHTNQAKLLSYATHLILGHGINDIVAGGSSAATLLSDMEAIHDLAPTLPCYLCTIQPVSSSTDNWATTANQTTSASDSVRLAANTLIRSVPAWAAGYFDISAPVEVTGSKWPVDGTAGKFTADGLHASQYGYYTIQYAGVIDPTVFGKSLPALIVNNTNATVTTSGGRTILSYGAAGTVTPNRLVKGDVLIVGGGGSGSIGGGGAGGYVLVSNAFIPAGATAITIGAGGASVTAGAGTEGNNGLATSFNGISSAGGGGGAGVNTNGKAGASGGGAGSTTGSAVTGGAGTAGRGNNGGGSPTAGAPFSAAGGGGAGAVGANQVSVSVCGAGGAGSANSITGSSVTYAGGGGGSAYSSGATYGSGGAGGGGAGGVTGTAGTDGRGGGGGGANNGQTSGKGGSGVVIISYPTS